eukprot:TRINITY_DN23980_c0_g1_i1.p1 TRINITY_DN23980_c0_g1~~TRINITY_DN23980_c0_g1_i1.p1  ORF type:complete len:273 (-),score=63.64 TRINITY_DN23980_c0_g1_i1:90-908(-)
MAYMRRPAAEPPPWCPLPSPKGTPSASSTPPLKGIYARSLRIDDRGNGASRAAAEAAGPTTCRSQALQPPTTRSSSSLLADCITDGGSDAGASSALAASSRRFDATGGSSQLAATKFGSMSCSYFEPFMDPESDLRTFGSSLPPADWSRIRKMRTDTNCPTYTRESATCKNVGTASFSNDSLSLQTLMDKQRRHQRRLGAPATKYKPGAVTSHDIGWFANNDEGLARHPSAVTSLGEARKPKYGVTQSKETKFYNNMKATGAEASMRLLINH